MGTELTRRGVTLPTPLWSGAALLTHPEVVFQIHLENVAAGADILVANTFRTNPRTLHRAGCESQGQELIWRAVELARQATRSARKRIYVAASVAPVEDCYRPDWTPPDDELRREHIQLADQIARSGADLIWIETMGTAREALIAAESARAAGVGFALSFVTREDGRLLGGDALPDAIEAILPLRPAAIGLNCVPPTGLTLNLRALCAAIDLILTRTRLPRPEIAAYAHICNADPLPGWSHTESCDPRTYWDHARAWVEIGASIIGGCCGTTPEHISMLTDSASSHRAM